MAGPVGQQLADPLPHSIGAARAELAVGRISAEELVLGALARIDDRNPGLNAYLHLDPEAALAVARAQDRSSSNGPLAGIPLCIKDVIDVAGMPTTAGAKAWHRSPAADAEAVNRLRTAGAVILGKGNTNEFAYGIDGRNPHRGDCGNPLDPARMSGGSSSGPAVAVATGMALGGLGTDTSGSLRVPASLCGLVAVRPTLGAVPMDGIVPLAWTYDVVGPLARTVADAALLLGVLAPGSIDGGAVEPDVTGLTIGLADELLDVCTPSIAHQVRKLAGALENAGAELVSVALPPLAPATAFHLTIQGAEAATVHAPWFSEQRDSYAPDVRARLEAGQALTAVAYVQAQRSRNTFLAKVVAALSEVDVLLAPSTPIVAPYRDAESVSVEGRSVPVRAALLSCTVPFSQLGWPVVSVPAGHVDGLPFGAQLVGRPRTETTLLRAAAVLEASTERGRRSPGEVRDGPPGLG